MSRLTLAAALALVMSASITRATSPNSGPATFVFFYSGEELTTHCRAFMNVVRNQMHGQSAERILFDATQCRAYVTGVLDTLAFEGVKPSQFAPAFCLPRGLNAKTATEVVANYADQNPQARSDAAYQIIRRALAAAYPCR
jgi:hypothetical protein